MILKKIFFRNKVETWEIIMNHYTPQQRAAIVEIYFKNNSSIVQGET